MNNSKNRKKIQIIPGIIAALCIIILISLCYSISDENKHTLTVKMPRDNTPVIVDNIPSGIDVLKRDGVELDYSNINDGYVMARYTGNDYRGTIIRLNKDDKQIHYSLSGQGNDWTTFPIHASGKYFIEIGLETNPDRYHFANKQEVDVELTSHISPYIRPNFKCPYNEESAVIKFTQNFLDAKNIYSDEDVIYELIDWFKKSDLQYDYEKKERFSSERKMFPHMAPDEVIETGKGLCGDFSALLCAMLRSQNIPAKLIWGRNDAEDKRHGWVSVYHNDEWNDYDPTTLVLQKNRAKINEYQHLKKYVEYASF